MNKQELLEYMCRAKDLEADVYQNQLLQKDFNQEKRLCAPRMSREPLELLDEKEPKLPELDKVESSGIMIAKTVAYGLGGVVGIVCSVCMVILGGIIEKLGGLGMLFLSLGLLAFAKDTPASNKKAKENNQRKMKEYECSVKQYKESYDSIVAENQRRRKANEEVLNEYSRDIACYKDYCKNTFDMICDVGKKLSETLESLYAENIIYPKYRNMVAVTTIYEYLESGRCSQLDGPDGAYNLYEMELRQNVIIGQLSSIASNLERIKERQFALYNEVNEANQRANTLLTNIGDSVAFSAYQNKAMKDSLETMKYIEMSRYVQHK